MSQFIVCKDLLDNLPHDEKNNHNELIRAGKETTLEQFQYVIKRFIEVFDKNFKEWRGSLVPLTIASSNSRAATACAKWYLVKKLSEELADTTDICLNALSMHI